MLFLNFWDDVVQNIGMILERMLNVLWLLLCQIVYPFISTIFKLFTNITGSLTDGRYAGDLNDIVNRIVLILTIVMTFYIVFEFVKYTVTPDTISDKEKGAMPLFARIVIAILLLAFVPKIFNLASEFQNIVINKNVIGKIIYPKGSGNNIAGLGREFSGDLLSSFVYVECYTNETKNSADCKSAYEDVDKLIDNAKNTGLMPAVSLTFGNPRIRFAGLLALIVGCFVLYVVFLYCKDIALREIQLLFLQIFSPVAIMSYIAPKKDGLFQKWLKQCTTTYLDLFIRLAALYFMLLMIELLGTKLLYEGADDNGIFVYVFLIIGLMMFLKKLPKLLGELFPSSGAASIGMGFKASDRHGLLGGIRTTAARAAGAIAGGTRAFKGRKGLYSSKELGKGKIKGLRRFGTTTNAMARSGWEGFKAGKDGKINDAIRAGQEKVQQYETIVATGGTVLGHDYRAGHYQNIVAEMNVTVSKLEDDVKQKEVRVDLAKRIKTAQDAVEDRAKSKIEDRSQKIKVNDLTKLDLDLAHLQSAYGIQLTAGQTTSQMYTQISAAAKLQSDTVVAKTQAYEQAQAQLRAATASGDASQINMAQLDVDTIEAELKAAAQKSAELEALKGKALKELARYSITVTADGSVPAGEVEQGLSDKIAEARGTLSDVKKGLEAQIAALRAQGKTNDEIKIALDLTDDALFAQIDATGDFAFKSFGDLDGIQSKFTSYASAVGTQIATKKEEIRMEKEKAENVMATANSGDKK